MSTKYRHEWKHVINGSDLLSIRSRVRAVCRLDPNTVDGKYIIRSLYFDTPDDRALKEKVNGVDRREKFRIRFYNYDTSAIFLEKKVKRNGLGTKYKARLTEDEVEMLLRGDLQWMKDPDRPLVLELYGKMTDRCLQPKVIVEYTREPYIYCPGNVRVTFDYDLRTSLKVTDFLDGSCVTIPAGDAPIILEVKWDEYLPSIIKAAVQTNGRRAEAFSKYAQCRIYG